MSAPLRLRVALPPVVLLAGLEPALAASARETLSGGPALFEVTRPRDCRTVIERHAGVTLVCVVPSEEETELGRQLMELRVQFPHVPMVALFVESVSDSRWTLQLGRAGVTELVPCARIVPAPMLVAALTRCESDTLAVRMWKAARLQVSDPLSSVLKPALRRAHAPITLESLADATKMHERTLRKYCETHGLASPQWIIGWARMLVAAYYLDEPGRTVQSISELLQFPSAVSLANYMRRYTRLTPSALRTAGAVTTVGRMLEQQLAPKESTAARASDVRSEHASPLRIA